MKRSQQGFTLVELAIVLVIIGLIVGGVLVGQDLIKAATLQKGIRQLSDTEAAATTFRTKYNGLPGDLNGDTANTVFTTANSFTAVITNGSSATRGRGDGNGIIEAISTTGGAVTATLGASGEAAAFYPELFNAGYIKESMNSVDMSSITLTQTALTTGTFYALASGGANKPLIVPGAASNRNYLTIVGAPSSAAAAGVPTWTAGVTPIDASSIDGKLDDGVANTGAVLSVAAAAVPGTFAGSATGTANACASTGGIYAVATATQVCNVSYRASF